MTDPSDNSYAGDISVRETWDALAGDPRAVLIDVRSAAEWSFVGVPLLVSIGKEPLMVAWNDFATGERIPDFTGRLKSALDAAGVGTDAPLYFLCRSGNRSRHAAIAATAAGYGRSYNIDIGFEGGLDANRHRATPGSWKAAGLPWVQS